MDLPIDQEPADPRVARLIDRRRFRQAFGWAVLSVAALWWVKAFEVLSGSGFRALGVEPHQLTGLVGVVAAPLLHGSMAHLVSNSLPMLLLLTLAISTVPRATARAVPLIWIGSGLFVWFFGRDSIHIGASGLAHGLMVFLFTLGLLRRHRASVAAAMIAFFMYGGMVLTVLPREDGISWESHLGGAIFGVLAALAWFRLDPRPPRKRYSFEDDFDAEELGNDEFMLPRPADVPRLWDGPGRGMGSPASGEVVPFEPRSEPPTRH